MTAQIDSSRADKVRQRRTRRSPATGRRSGRRRDARSGKLPPMVGRSRNFEGSISARGRRRSHKTRRRFDIALGVPGAEIHLPAVPHIRIGWRTLSGILVVLLLGLLYTLWNSTTFQVGVAEVVGIDRLTTQEVNTVLGVSGSSIFMVEPRELERELQEAFPELYDISVRVRFPAAVYVDVKERIPVLAWEQNGLTLWIDDRGVAFPPRGEAEIPVTVEALDAPETVAAREEGMEVFIDPLKIPPIQAVGERLPEGTVLLYDSEHGLGWNDPNGWQVFIGQNEYDMETKLEVYEALVEKLEKDQIQPALISVEFMDAPYYRLDR